MPPVKIWVSNDQRFYSEGARFLAEEPPESRRLLESAQRARSLMRSQRFVVTFLMDRRVETSETHLTRVKLETKLSVVRLIPNPFTMSVDSVESPQTTARLAGLFWLIVIAVSDVAVVRAGATS